MKRKKVIVTIVAFVVIVLVVISFVTSGTESEDKILGKWTCKNEKTKLETEFEFFEDKSFYMKINSKSLKNELSGTWIILDDGRLKSTFLFSGVMNILIGKLKFPKENIMKIDDDTCKKSK